jgi:serine/threonine protein kinase
MDLESDERLTRTGAAVGTPVYMSPEQITGDREEVGPGSDLYGLGVIIYEMVSGQRPYDGHSLADLRDKIMTRSYEPLRQLVPDAPAELELLLSHLLEPDPSRRLSNAAELREALEWLRSRHGPPPPSCRLALPTPRERRSLLFSLALIAASALIAIPVFLFYRPAQPSFDKDRAQKLISTSLERIARLRARIGEEPEKVASEAEDLGARLSAITVPATVSLDFATPISACAQLRRLARYLAGQTSGPLPKPDDSTLSPEARLELAGLSSPSESTAMPKDG